MQQQESVLSAPPLTHRLGAAVLTTLISAALWALPSPAHAARDIPVGVGVYNLHGARSQDGLNRIWAMRFVLDRDTHMDRLFTGFNMEGVYTDPFGRPAPVELRSRVLNKGYGAPPPPTNLPSGWTTGTGRIDYGHGNGGRLRARLVPMKADGTPDLGTVLAEETFYPVERYKETKAEFAIDDRAGLVYARFGGVALRAGTPYWVIYQNVDPNPRMNYISYNSPVVKDSESGPNGRNNLDPNMPGAILGLDPREVVGWTWDGAATWKFGREVGGGGTFIPGDYVGSSSTDDGARVPWYAWQETGSTRLHSNQPYMSYPDGSGPGRYTLRVMDSPARTVLTEAGGYAPTGHEVGVVTVRNVRTGETGRTAWLRTGLRRGVLDHAVTVETGDTYEVTNSGAVWKAQGDNFLLSMGIVGPAATRTETVGQGNDRAELFAGPYMHGPGSPPPPPPPTPDPEPTPTPDPTPNPCKPKKKCAGLSLLANPPGPRVEARRRALRRCRTLRLEVRASAKKLSRRQRVRLRRCASVRRRALLERRAAEGIRRPAEGIPRPARTGSAES
jgi:hypothetical protein